MTQSKTVKHQGVPELFKRGNMGLLRLLIAVNSAPAPEGIATYHLLHQLGSTHHGKTFIARAEREGLIERITGESEHGQFPPVYNKITKKGKALLKQLLVS